MKRMVGLAMILALFGVLAVQAEEKDRIKVSPAFATAEEAVNFANSLQNSIDGNTQFVCEFHAGSPNQSSYKVVYELRPEEPLGDGNAYAVYGWTTDHIIAFNPRGAVERSNEIPFPPRYTSCWNPNRNPATTEITIFFLGVVSDIRYEAHGPFTSAQLAASWANENVNVCELHLTEFLATTNIATQVEPSWYVIVPKIENCQRKLKPSWRVYTKNDNGQPMDAEGAAEMANQHEFVSSFPYRFRYVPYFNTWDTKGAVALFVLDANEEQTAKIEVGPTEEKSGAADNDENHKEIARTNQPELTIPVRIFAEKSLLENSPERQREIVEKAVNSFHEQISFVRLEANYKIQEIADTSDVNPMTLGLSLPYVPNTIAILLVDHRLMLPSVDGEPGLEVAGHAGRSVVVVSVNEYYDSVTTPEQTLLHEVLHELGVPHKADPTSVMCSNDLLIIKGCPRSVMTIDGKSLVEIAGAVKAIKGIGFDTYTGIATRF